MGETGPRFGRRKVVPTGNIRNFAQSGELPSTSRPRERIRRTNDTKSARADGKDGAFLYRSAAPLPLRLKPCSAARQRRRDRAYRFPSGGFSRSPRGLRHSLTHSRRPANAG